MEDETKKIPRPIAALERAKQKREARIEDRAERRQAGDLRGQRARSATELLLERSFVGAIYAVAIVGCFFAGRVPTLLVVSAMAWMCCSEFFRLMRMYGRMPNEVLGLTAAIAFPVMAHFGVKWMWSVAFALGMSIAVWYVSNPRSSIADVAVTLLGACYTGMMFSSVVRLRAAQDGALLCLGVVGSIWLNDSFAYLVGTAFGRHKMAPKISPKKSWEGTIGGCVGCMVAWVLLYVLWPGDLKLWQALLCGAVVCASAVVGDLVESRVKRGAGVKDSGNLMPGHGGMLDRSDSLLFGCTCALFLLILLGVL